MKSFDIFDTVLIRKCGSAENLYYLLAYKIYSKDESQRDAFYHWRCHAEIDAKNKFKREPSLKDIYSTFDKDSFKNIEPDYILQTELKLEKENLIPNQEICSILKDTDDYIFISDMYLPSSFLIDILDSFKLLNNSNRANLLFISCEHNATKATGALYDIVKTTLGINTWTHYGDNDWSDIKLAKKKGLQTVKVNSTYSKVEQYYIHYTSLSPNKKIYDILINLQRATRLNLGLNNRTKFAIDCIAPLYISYVCHVLQTAQKRGITTLYFLSRDSYILYKIAQQYKTDYPHISLRYLFVSRKSLIYPCIYNGTSDEICELMGLESFKGENVKRIANYLQLEENAFKDLGFNRIKTEKEVSKFKKILNNYCDNIIKESTNRRQTLLKYFKQEGLLDSGKKALVDVGWLGTSRFLINRLLTKEGYDAVETFYLMNFPRVLPPSKGVYNSYLGECDFKSPIIPIIEVLFSASPYRSTLSYKIYNNKVLPVFNPSTNPAKSEIIRSNLIGALKLTNNIRKLKMDFSDIYYLWSKLAIKCISTPQHIDLEVLTCLEDQDEIGKSQNIINKISFLQLISYIFNNNQSSLFPYSIYYTNKKIAPYIIRLHNLNNKAIQKIKSKIKKLIR